MPLESVTVFMPDIFLSPYENKTHTLSKKSATNKDIISFIKKYSVPLVGQRTKKNDFKYTGRPLIVIYYDVNYEHQNFVADTQYIRGKVLEVSRNLFTFSWSASVEGCEYLYWPKGLTSFNVMDFTYVGNILTLLGNGCDSAGRAVASNSIDPRFESSHRQKFILNIYTVYCWKD